MDYVYIRFNFEVWITFSTIDLSGELGHIDVESLALLKDHVLSAGLV